MRPTRLLILLPLALASISPVSRAQGPFRAEVLKEAPPAALSAPIRAELAAEGIRIIDGKGNAFADIWLRKATPAKAKPSGANGTVLFPVLTEGVLIGALRYGEEGQDYRDQTIAKGLYTLRYGLQPQNGAHLGVSDFRDYAMLLPASKDTATADLGKKPLDERSAEAAGSSHPAVLMLLAPAEPAKAGEPAVVEDKDKNIWGVVLPLQLAVKGESSSSALDVQITVSGAAMP